MRGSFMRKVYNFSAGPGMVAEEVLTEAQRELLDWHGTGMSIMELGHRGGEFKEIVEASEENVRELLAIPKNYHVLFLAGGATAQFAMVPLNLLSENNSADYLDTGVWSKKALNEAKRYGEINIGASTRADGTQILIPPETTWHLNPKASYVHYTPNETIEGIEFNFVPETGEVPLVADMSSTILSQPIDVNQYGIIYAGAQKNIGQAGITLVIIRDDLLKEPLPKTPTLYNYKIAVENKSLYNTPPTFAWYIASLTFVWMKKAGGVAYFAEKNQRKAKKLYDFINAHADFYKNTVHPSCRSRMNVPFNLPSEALNTLFLQEANKVGLTNLKGHRLAGGVRASLYNAMPEEGVDALIDFMQDFEKKFG